MNKAFLIFLITFLSGCFNAPPQHRFYDYCINQPLVGSLSDNDLIDLLKKRGLDAKASAHTQGNWFCKLRNENYQTNENLHPGEDWFDIYIEWNIKKGSISISQGYGTSDANILKDVMSEINHLLDQKIGRESYEIEYAEASKSIFN